jgi:hypothetical protein
MVRVGTIGHELMHGIDNQQEARGRVCELRPYSMDKHRCTSVARITWIR